MGGATYWSLGIIRENWATGINEVIFPVLISTRLDWLKYILNNEDLPYRQPCFLAKIFSCNFHLNSFTFRDVTFRVKGSCQSRCPNLSESRNLLDICEVENQMWVRINNIGDANKIRKCLSAAYDCVLHGVKEWTVSLYRQMPWVCLQFVSWKINYIFSVTRVM